MLMIFVFFTSNLLSIEIIYATANPSDSFHGVYASKFKRIVEEKSKGSIKIKLFLDGKMGSEQDNVRQCSSGEIQMSTMAVNNITPYAPIVGVFTLPYLFKSKRECLKVLSSNFMNKIDKGMEKEANIKPLSWLIGGYRVLTNSKKMVKKLADLKGLKIRVPKNDIMIKSYLAWGGNPVPMGWTDVYQGLEKGVIDAQDNPHIVNSSSKFYKVQKYITDLHYILWIGPHICNEEFFKKLPLSYQNIIRESALEAQNFTNQWIERREKSALNICLKNGMKISKLEDEEVWMKKARSIWKFFYGKITSEKMVKEVEYILDD